MSEFDVKKITNRAGTGAPNFTYGLNIAGSDSGLMGKAFTSSGTEPSSPANSTRLPKKKDKQQGVHLLSTQ